MEEIDKLIKETLNKEEAKFYDALDEQSIFQFNISIIKLYLWMQMDKYAILREMKRLELQVMSLSGKVGE